MPTWTSLLLPGAHSPPDAEELAHYTGRERKGNEFLRMLLRAVALVTIARYFFLFLRKH